MTGSGTHRAFVLLVAVIASAGLFSVQRGFAAEPAAKAEKAKAVTVKQFSQELATELMNPRPGQGTLVDPLSPVQQQRMQQSLEAYFHTLVADMLAGEGGGVGAGSGVCLPGWPAMCRGDDDRVGSIPGDCMNNKQGYFGNCGEGESAICQRKGSTGTYKVTTKCRWVKTK